MQEIQLRNTSAFFVRIDDIIDTSDVDDVKLGDIYKTKDGIYIVIPYQYDIEIIKKGFIHVDIYKALEDAQEASRSIVDYEMSVVAENLINKELDTTYTYVIKDGDDIEVGCWCGTDYCGDGCGLKETIHYFWKGHKNSILEEAKDVLNEKLKIHNYYL